MRSSPKSVPWIVRRFVTKYEWRHVKVIVGVRAVVAVWLLVLGSILCAYGYWWGALLFLAAGLQGWVAYQMPRWKLALDAETGRQAPKAA
ncbi:MAG: hypothetical protein ABSA65_18045 [Acidimicrobiales bacterium]